MNHPAKAIATRDVRGRSGRCATFGLRRHQVQGPVGPMTVVVINEDAQNMVKMRLVEHQEPIETLGANRPHESLRDAVGLRRTKWRTNDLDPIASKHLVKTVGEFQVAVANQEPDAFRAPRPRSTSVAGLAG